MRSWSLHKGAQCAQGSSLELCSSANPSDVLSPREATDPLPGIFSPQPTLLASQPTTRLDPKAGAIPLYRHPAGPLHLALQHRLQHSSPGPVQRAAATVRATREMSGEGGGHSMGLNSPAQVLKTAGQRA